MDIDEYFKTLSEYLDRVYSIASDARKKGYDPETFVEIKPAPDLASRVEGIIGLDGIADVIRSKSAKTRQELAFEMVREICTNNKFNMQIENRLTLAIRIGLTVLTEGILVAPTEGFQKAVIHKSLDGSDYLAVLYAGPIRGAGGTGAALSVALADLARKIMNIGEYKAQKVETERYIEEILLYHSRIARLQYLPSEADMRTIIENCPVCVDGLPTEDLEVSIRRNIKRLDATGKEEAMTNRIRGGVPLVLCEGIAQKAKSVLKHTKNAGLDWHWLNNIIKVDKAETKKDIDDSKNIAVFLQELVAGRPVLSYPEYPGAFRLRYGRSRFTGIASKGFNPATMLLLDEYIATGTQVKIEKPGKGCIAVPVDSIEGPFVKLDDGRAFRINNFNDAVNFKDKIKKIISVGDILITLGDFKKTNTPLQPTSYVEEYWYLQLKGKNYTGDIPNTLTFNDALEYSKNYNIPMHPSYTYDYNDINVDELVGIINAINLNSIIGKDAHSIESIEINLENNKALLEPFERLCIPHIENNYLIKIESDHAKSLLYSLGFVDDNKVTLSKISSMQNVNELKTLTIVNTIAPFTIMKRSTRIGGRIGRPEKAKERLTKPPPQVLFPIGEYGGKERNVIKAYLADKKRLGGPTMEMDIAAYRCSVGRETLYSIFCEQHKCRASIERICNRCGRKILSDICPTCEGIGIAHQVQKIDMNKLMEQACKRVGVNTASMPKLIKGVKGIVNKTKEVEALEKGLLRSINGIYIFKDGTSRFDATDVPITHFYPKEIELPLDKLHALGYTKDYYGNEITRSDQIVEIMHQDVILNRRGAEYMLKIARFVDMLLVRYYGMEAFYNLKGIDDLIGHCVVTLSPHTSAGVLCRVIGFTDANVGLAHPYVISARRRNCDGDEDTTMLLLDMLINFSKKYLPTTIGGTMDAPLILTANVKPEEVDDEVWEMEIVDGFDLDFYDKTLLRLNPGETKVERVANRINNNTVYSQLKFTHLSGPTVLLDAPKKSMYTRLKSMDEKIDRQFKLMDKLCTIDKADTARRLIMSHFIPDLIGNLHSFSKQTFRCVSCNAKYRRVPLSGICRKCKGKLVLTISKGGIEKYLNTAIDLAERYKLENYLTQRLKLIKTEIETVFGGVGGGEKPTRQFNLSSYI